MPEATTAAAPGRAGAEAADEPALAGVRVVEIGSGVAGPFCARLLADQGADVVKVERPAGGDTTRRVGPFATGRPHLDAGALFLALNTGKRSVALDAATSTGAELLRRLLATADVVVSGLRPADAERLGLDDAALEAANPGAVRVAITSWGLSGPLRDAPASELVMGCVGGLAYLTGEFEDPPMKPALEQCQYMAGAHAAVAASACLLEAELTGRGRLVELYGGALSFSESNEEVAVIYNNLAMVAVLHLMCLGLYRYIELPARTTIRNLLDRKPKPKLQVVPTDAPARRAA